MTTPRETLLALEKISKTAIEQDSRPEFLRHMMRRPENATIRCPFVYGTRWGDTPEGLDDASLYYRFLYSVARKFAPAYIIEIGTLCGWSAAHLAAGNEGGRLISLDIDFDGVRRGRDIANEFGIKNAEFIMIDSIAFASSIWLRDIVDIVFIDGEHTYERATREIELYLPMMRSGGIVMIDDITLDEGMRRVWDGIQFPKAELPGLHMASGCGFGVFIKP